MREFNATFNTERAKRGSSPINLIEFLFAGGTVSLSDRDITPAGGALHLGLIKQWGFIDSARSGDSGLLGKIDTPDLSLTIINSTTPAFSSLFDGDSSLEATPVILYQWFAGTPDSAKEIIFKGYVSGYPRHTLAECQMTITGLWSRVNRLIGSEYILTSADYPLIDPDDIGTQGNIIYGDVEGAPCRAIESGGVTTLAEGCFTTDTTLTLSATTEFAPSGLIGIDDERISYTGKTATSLTGCTRGAAANNTITKNTGSTNFDSGAASVQTIAGDGGVAFSVLELGTSRLCGLSNSNADVDYQTIGYALALGGNNTVYIYENGTMRGGAFCAFVSGDRFSIERVGTTVVYKKNGSILYTSLVASTGSLLVDVSLYTPGATVSEAALTDAANGMPQMVIWKDLVGVALGTPTTPVIHSEGSNVWQITSRFVYLVASHPVASIGDCFVDGVRIPAATKYTGRPGDELAGYAGKAVFTVPARLTRAQAIELLISNGLSAAHSIEVLNTAFVDSTGLTISDSTTIDTSAFYLTHTLGTDISTLTVSDNIAVAAGTLAAGNGSLATTPGSHAHGSAAEIIAWKLPVTSFGGSGGVNLQNINDGNFNTFGYSTSHSTISMGHGYAESFSGNPTSFRLCVRSNAATDTQSYFSFGGVSVGTFYSQGVQAYSGWQSYGGTWAQFSALAGTLELYGVQVAECWIEVQYTPSTSASGATGVGLSGAVTMSGAPSKTGGAYKGGSIGVTGAVSKAGTLSRAAATLTKNLLLGGEIRRQGSVWLNGSISLSGNSVADVEIGKVVVANVVGHVDDASGTTTGTPNAVISRPDHVFKHLLTHYLGQNLADYSDDAAAYFAANSYAFALLISKPVWADELLSRLALQCRCRFFFLAHGAMVLRLGQTGASSQKAISKNVIKRDSVAITRTANGDIVNAFAFAFDLDHRLPASSMDSYRGALMLESATSIAIYGRRDYAGDASLLYFDAIRSEAMAVDVADFILSWFKRSRKMPELSVFLDNMEIVPGDRIALSHDLDSMSGLVCEVLSTRQVLGSGRDKRMDCLEIKAIENGV